MSVSANISRAIALLDARISLESQRLYQSSYASECLDELKFIRRLLRARKSVRS